MILQLRWLSSPAGGGEDKFSAPCCMSQAPKVLMHAKLLKLKCWFEIHGLEESSVTPVTAFGPLGRSHPLNKRAKLRSRPFWAITEQSSFKLLILRINYFYKIKLVIITYIVVLGTTFLSFKLMRKAAGNIYYLTSYLSISFNFN